MTCLFPKTSSQITEMLSRILPPGLEIAEKGSECHADTSCQILKSLVETFPSYRQFSQCACVMANSIFYGFSCVGCTSAMFLFLFLRYPHHRDAFRANWRYLGVVATFTLGESPLKMTCIIACTPGFHSPDLKLQKRGVATMPILVAKSQQALVKCFQVTGTFLIAYA